MRILWRCAVSTQSPWRPAYSRNPDEPIEVHEELDSPPRRRWPMVAVAVVALLVGLGLGNVIFGATAEDVRVANGLLETAQVERDEARTAAKTATRSEATAERRLEQVAEDLAREGTDRDALVIALARAVGAQPTGAGATPDPAAVKVVEDGMASLNAGRVDRLVAMYAPDAVFTFYLADSGEKFEFTGRSGVRGMLESNGRYHVRARGPIHQAGDFVWFRYEETHSSGVTVMCVVDGKVARHWVVITGP